MGEKIRNYMDYNPQNPQNEGLVPDKLEKISPQMENEMKKLTIKTRNKEEGENSK